MKGSIVFVCNGQATEPLSLNIVPRKDEYVNAPGIDSGYVNDIEYNYISRAGYVQVTITLLPPNLRFPDEN